MSVELRQDQEPGGIDEQLTCRNCQALADGANFYKITRSFRTAPEGSIRPTIWRPPLVCRIIKKPVAGLTGEWGYMRHALLEHPEERGAYVPLCLHPDRITRR
jgi:hypothetical protein